VLGYKIFSFTIYKKGVVMKRYYDATNLPKKFLDFLYNFLDKLEHTGYLFFYPDECKLLLGREKSGEYELMLAPLFEKSLNIKDVEYLIKIALIKKNWFVEITDTGDEERVNHEYYITLFLFDTEYQAAREAKQKASWTSLQLALEDLQKNSTPDF